MTDWRKDEAWRLVYAVVTLASKVNDRPPPKAELAQDPCWATLYADDNRSPLATWTRTLGVPEKEKQAMEKRASRRKDVERAARA